MTDVDPSKDISGSVIIVKTLGAEGKTDIREVAIDPIHYNKQVKLYRQKGNIWQIPANYKQASKSIPF